MMHRQAASLNRRRPRSPTDDNAAGFCSPLRLPSLMPSPPPVHGSPLLLSDLAATPTVQPLSSVASSIGVFEWERVQADLSCSPLPRDDDGAAVATITSPISIASATCAPVTSSSKHNKALTARRGLDLAAPRFSDIAFLGEGGYGTVFRARDNVLHRDVAVKVLTFACGTEEGQRAQALGSFGNVAVLLAGQEFTPTFLARELRAHTALQSVRGTMPLLDCVVRGDVDCAHAMLVLPLLLPLFAPTAPVTPASQRLATSAALCLAVAAMHGRGWMHRDITPSNVFLPLPQEDATQPTAAILGDFGLATTMRRYSSVASSSSSATTRTTQCCTLWYRAPELLRGDGSYDASLDAWSLGAVLYELVAGRPLFPGCDDADQAQQIDEAFGRNGERSEEFWQSQRARFSADSNVAPALLDACAALMHVVPAKRITPAAAAALLRTC